VSENFLSQPKQINLNLQLVYIVIMNDPECVSFFIVSLLFGKNQIFGLSKITKAYGSMCTIWLGTKPIIFINNLDLAKKVFEKNHEIFGGRSGYAIKSIFLQNQGLDILFTDGHQEWAELRKIGYKCIRYKNFTFKLVILKTFVKTSFHFRFF
jgi:hypothetical protein